MALITPFKPDSLVLPLVKGEEGRKGGRRRRRVRWMRRRRRSGGDDSHGMQILL